MKKQISGLFFAGAALIAMAACSNGNGPAKGSVIQNETMRDTTNTQQTPAADTMHHM